jgi:hypothetical protein
MNSLQRLCKCFFTKSVYMRHRIHIIENPYASLMLYCELFKNKIILLFLA